MTTGYNWIQTNIECVYSNRTCLKLLLYWGIAHLFGLVNIFLSVTDECFVDEMRVWRKYGNLFLVSMMSLFAH